MNALNGLVGFAVKRWQFTVLLFLMFAALGVSSWMAIPRAEDPDFPVPIFTTVAVYPGASPEDMEQLVTEPIEKKLNALEDVKKLTSTSSDGLSVILVEFKPEVDTDRKYDQVLREINALRADLPIAGCGPKEQRTLATVATHKFSFLESPSQPTPSPHSR